MNTFTIPPTVPFLCLVEGEAIINTRTVLIFGATLVIGGLALTGLANGLGNADEKAPFNDAWLTAKTKIALFTDARVRGREINIESPQGLVMIRGQVDSSHAPSRLYLFRAPRLALASLGRMIAVQW